MGGQSRRIYRRVSGIRLKGGWTSGLARVKIARNLIAIAEYWRRMPSVRWPLEFCGFVLYVKVCTLRFGN